MTIDPKTGKRKRYRESETTYGRKHRAEHPRMTAARHKRHDDKISSVRPLVAFKRQFLNEHSEVAAADYRSLIHRFKMGICTAANRNLIWSLNFGQYVVAVYKQPCYHCDKPITCEHGSGLDRLDNRRGYLPGNVVASCRTCNWLKGRIEGLGFVFPRTLELMHELQHQAISTR